jgi:hypothetical protein
MRDLSLVVQPSREPRPHFLCMGPSLRSKPITALLRDPACQPFCFAQDMVSPELRHSPWRASNYFLNPTIHHRHQVPGELRGPTLCRQATAKSELHPNSSVRYSIDMRKEEDPANFPRAIIDLMVNAHCMTQESLATFVVKS